MWRSTFTMITRHNGYAQVFGNQMSGLSSCECVVSFFRVDLFTPGGFEDHVMNNWMNLFAKQNPFVVC